MAVAVPTLLQSPENSEGNRQYLYPINTTDEVLMSDDTEKTLTEGLAEMGAGAMEINASQPDHACIWFKPDS